MTAHGAPFRLHGVPIPRTAAQDAPDGTFVFEADTELPVCRSRYLPQLPDSLDWLPGAWVRGVT